jgi:hypothetical protein
MPPTAGGHLRVVNLTFNREYRFCLGQSPGAKIENFHDLIVSVAG